MNLATTGRFVGYVGLFFITSLAAGNRAVAQPCDVGAWITRIPVDRVSGAMTYDIARGRMIHFGGLAGSGSSTIYFNDTLAWDGQSWAPMSPSVSPTPRAHHAMTYDPVRQRVVLFAGTATSNPETWEWDGSNWSLRSTTGPANRIHHSLVYDLFRNRTLLYGGGPLGGGTPHSDGLWEWDGTNWSHPTQVTSPAPRINPGAAYDSARKRMVIFGGSDNGFTFRDTWEWDSPTQTWSQVNNTGPPSGNGGHGMVYDAARSKTVLFGGSLSQAQTWEWNGATWTLRSTSGPQPRSQPQVAYDGSRARTVLFGGGVADATRPLRADVWEWDGTSWTQTCNSGPGLRTQSSSVFDSGRNAVVVFGGETNASDTWFWDGVRWKSLEGPMLPGRAAASMSYDSARSSVVLFGGEVGINRLNDTWELTPAGWEQRFPATSPSPRASAMVHDEHIGKTVLYGGNDNATWLWDGTNWSLWGTSGPGNRFSHAMAYDPVRHVVVLFGGMRITGSLETLLGDTWEWDGAGWTQRSSTGPSPRYRCSMVYDTQRARCLMFGGQTDAYTLKRDAWEWDGTTWTQRSEQLPIARQGLTSAYDSVRRRTVVLGGNVQSTQSVLSFTDTFEFTGSSSPSISRPPTVVTGCYGTPGTLTVLATGESPLVYQWRLNGIPVTDGGRWSGATTAALTINPLSFVDAGQYDVVISNTCGSITSTAASVSFPCRANCDCSAAAPILNANDFQCFLNRFAAGDDYANCDGSTAPPVLSANDFQCFLNLYATGCS